MKEKRLSKEHLHIDQERESARIGHFVQNYLKTYKKRGVVVSVSGGVDSSVTASLCCRAVGPQRVYALFTPERESSPESKAFFEAVVNRLGVEWNEEDITPVLESAGCYERRNQAMRELVPGYNNEYRMKLFLQPYTESRQYRIFHAAVQSPGGVLREIRMTPKAYLGVVAAMNFKQRVRKMLEYYHADRLNYAVAGTQNKLEYELGFFVKQGDGAADIKPIAHLYKTQVYQLARYLGVPPEVIERTPTTDTYSLPQTQEEFYFSLSLEQMDLCMYGIEQGFSTSEIGEAIGCSEDMLRTVLWDISNKQRGAEYLHKGPCVLR